MNINLLRKKLSQRLHQNELYEIINYAQGTESNSMKWNLYYLLFDTNKRVSDNAAWVFNHFDLYNNQWLYPKHDELINETMHTRSDTKRRLLLNLLLRQPFSKANFRTDFFDFCLEHLSSLKAPTSIRVLCIKLAYKQSSLFSELLFELQNTLEFMDADLLPAGLKTIRRNVLKNIQKYSAIHINK